MASKFIRRRAYFWLSVVGLVTLTASLILLSRATQYAGEYSQWYGTVLAINIFGVVVLGFLIAANLLRLIKEYKAGQPGSSLNARVLLMFVTLAVVPLSLVFYFSVQFLNRGIDSYFNVDVESALAGALDLSRTSLEMQTREYLQRTSSLAADLSAESDDLVLRLSQLREQYEASELTLIGSNRQIVATSSGELNQFPKLPPEDVLLSAQLGQPHIGLDTKLDGEVIVHAAATVTASNVTNESMILYAIFPVDARIAALTDQVRDSLDQYGEVSYLRGFLKSSFTLTLGLALLVSLLAAVWGAFVFSRRLIAPIQSLVGGTQAVAAGDFSKRLPKAGHDDLGFLVNSFNAMTEQLQNAKNETEKSRLTVERERARLAIILARLSAGVMVVDENINVHTVNKAASKVLDFDFATLAAGTSLTETATGHPFLEALTQLIAARFSNKQTEWREQLEAQSESGSKVLIVASTALPTAEGSAQRCVIVFEDVTRLMQAQKQAAWGEVARRLAHEIKNPLTPIQLSAERLEKRFASNKAANSELVRRSTQTIIQQVEAMKDMVNAFSEYARPPALELVATDVNALIEEMIELYRYQPSLPQIELSLTSAAPIIMADAGRLRQIIHNLVLNAIEACQQTSPAYIKICTVVESRNGQDMLKITVRDNGPGFQIDTAKVFEPYMTSKAKGTGLGLAIVRKLIEEHGGKIKARNHDQGGAEVVCWVPCEISDEIPLSENLAA